MHPNPDLSKPACSPKLWHLDPSVVFLNHGAFGGCPIAVLERQNQWRMQMERQPVQFLGRDLEQHLDSARAALAQFVGAAVEDLVFVSNATAGANTVLRSLRFEPGDELLTTNHAYNATRNAFDFVAGQFGIKVVAAKLPFPFQTEADLVEPILAAVTSRTRLALIDHVTSPTGFILPIERIVRELSARGVDVLVDGAHAPGMIPLNVEKIGAAYYTGNCHKWLCAPKGAAFLHVRKDRQHQIRPLVISHGASSRRTDRSRFQIEFAWTGTGDSSACLSIPSAIEFIGAQLPGGWPDVMQRNRALALVARKILCDTLEVEPPCPEQFIGTLAAIPLPDAPENGLPRPPIFEYPLQDELRHRHSIEVPIMPWPGPPKRLLRIAAQLYNSLEQYELLARCLPASIKEER